MDAAKRWAERERGEGGGTLYTRSCEGIRSARSNRGKMRTRKTGGRANFYSAVVTTRARLGGERGSTRQRRGLCSIPIYRAEGYIHTLSLSLSLRPFLSTATATAVAGSSAWHVVQCNDTLPDNVFISTGTCLAQIYSAAEEKAHATARLCVSLCVSVYVRVSRKRAFHQRTLVNVGQCNILVCASARDIASRVHTHTRMYSRILCVFVVSKFISFFVCRETRAELSRELSFDFCRRVREKRDGARELRGGICTSVSRKLFRISWCYIVLC